jgi:hypothetical protein
MAAARHAAAAVVAGMRMGSGRRPRAAAAAADADAAAPWPSLLLPRCLPACLPQRRRRRPCTTARDPREKQKQRRRRRRLGSCASPAASLAGGRGRVAAALAALLLLPPLRVCHRRRPACLPPPAPASARASATARKRRRSQSVSRSVGDAEDGELQGGGGSWAAAAAAAADRGNAPGQPRATTPPRFRPLGTSLSQGRKESQARPLLTTSLRSLPRNVLAGALCSIELVLEALATLAPSQTLERSGSSRNLKLTIADQFHNRKTDPQEQASFVEYHVYC